jgi:hypothetical protein
MFLNFTVHRNLYVWVRVNLKNQFQYLDNTSPHHRVLAPPPLSAEKASRNHLNEFNTPYLPTGICYGAKPYQIYVKQRSCADVNSPYQRKC